MNQEMKREKSTFEELNSIPGPKTKSLKYLRKHLFGNLMKKDIDFAKNFRKILIRNDVMFWTRNSNYVRKHIYNYVWNSVCWTMLLVSLDDLEFNKIVMKPSDGKPNEIDNASAQICRVSLPLTIELPAFIVDQFSYFGVFPDSLKHAN